MRKNGNVRNLSGNSVRAHILLPTHMNTNAQTYHIIDTPL